MDIITETGAIVVKVEQDNCAAIWASIEAQVADGNTGVVLDFSEVDYLNSMNIASIITLRNKVAQTGAKLALAELKDQIASIFRILKLERMFDLGLDRTAALADVTES